MRTTFSMRLSMPLSISLLCLAALSLPHCVTFAEDTARPEPPAPFQTLNPPPGVKPSLARGRFPNSSTRYPARTWTPEERSGFEQRLDWFHQAKWGIAAHYLPRMSRGPLRRIGERWQAWDDAKWDAWVDAVDVEAFAKQAEQLDVGFVVVAIGQNHRYFTSPNPVIEELWELEPGQFSSRRDLPMELGRALQRRGIPLMIYISTDKSFGVPAPEGVSRDDVHKNWVKVCRWYSDHYGDLCRGWWVDGVGVPIPGYARDIHEALRHGNPDTLIASGTYELSDFVHGHCTSHWGAQQRVKPYFGRWDPDHDIQSHVFLHLGSSWAASDAPKKTEDLVRYAGDIVRGGGVITFDIGISKMVDGHWQAPHLEIPSGQFEQLKAVRDALNEISASDGSGLKRNRDAQPSDRQTGVKQ